MKAKDKIRSNKLGVINILIADDNPIERLGLRTLLESEPNFKVVGEASDGLEAVQMVKRLSPDVVILNSMMSLLNGIEAARQVRAQFPQIGIMIFSRIESEAYKVEALSSGADTSVFEQSPTEDLLVAVHKVLARRRYVSPSLNESAVNSNVQDTRSIKEVESGPLITLTPRERENLNLVVQGYTNREIAQRLTISKRTVESHRSNIMHKLGFKSSIQLAHFALEHRLILIK